jgi:protein SCO1/2
MKPQHFALIIPIGLLISMLAARVLLLDSHHHHEEAEAASHTSRLRPMFPAPDFSYVDQRGKTVTKQSLFGKPWVANFVFTTCRTVCPLLTAKMVQLQRKLPDVPVRFVSFSVDPTHDTPQALLEYAMHWAPDEARWSLLATDDKTLPGLAAAFKVSAEKNTDQNAVDPIIHSSVFVLVDGSGVVRGVYDSETREQFVALATDLRTLSASLAPTPHPERDGATLYKELSCGGCHDRPELAPALGGLIGKHVEMTDAEIVTADEAYVRQSIVLPDLKRVRGYTLKMPTYDGVMDEAELTTLVKYLAALPEASAQPAPVEEEDPVCHMKISVVADTPALERDGKKFHFCSQACRDTFAKH